MTSISITDLLTIIDVLVDDGYQDHGRTLLNGKVYKRPVFKDSEVITRMVAHDFIPYPAETQDVELIRANDLVLFPKLVDQSPFNRRAWSLRLWVEQFRRFWIVQKGWHWQTNYLLDTKPVPLIDYLSNCDILVDKGFLGFEWQTRMFDQTNILIWTPKRRNQHVQNSKAFDRWLSMPGNALKAFFMKSKTPAAIWNDDWQKRWLVYVLGLLPK